MSSFLKKGLDDHGWEIVIEKELKKQGEGYDWYRGSTGVDDDPTVSESQVWSSAEFYEELHLHLQSEIQQAQDEKDSKKTEELKQIQARLQEGKKSAAAPGDTKSGPTSDESGSKFRP